MAKNLERIAKKLESQLKNTQKAALRIIKKHEKIVRKMIIEQMDKGIKGNGKAIGHYAPGPYRNEKIAETGSDLVNLEKTGEFKSEIFIDTDGLPVIASSFSYKTSFLVENYGEDIFQLTEENKEILFKLLQEEIKKHFKSLLDV